MYCRLNILLKPYSQIHLGSDESVGDAKKAQQQPGSEVTATGAAAAVAEAAVVASVPPPLSPPLQPGCLSRPHCEYLQLCRRFRQSLSLPSAYFSSPAAEGVAAAAVCHCAACHRLRGDPAYVKKGSPVRDSSTPVGWCRCGK